MLEIIVLIDGYLINIVFYVIRYWNSLCNWNGIYFFYFFILSMVIYVYIFFVRYVMFLFVLCNYNFFMVMFFDIGNVICGFIM